MAYGLTPNSPIQLQLSRENFNAMIGRHGQYIRWMSSQKCPCIKDNRKVDAGCTICHGSGEIYSTITECEEIVSAVVEIDGYVRVPNNEGIIWIRDSYGNDLTITGYCEDYAHVTGVLKGQTVLIKYNETIKASGTGTATYIGNKTFMANIPFTTETGEIQSELLSVSTEEAVTIDSIYRNYFTIEEDAWTVDLDVSYTYVIPLKFAILSQNLKEDARKYLVEKGGDCMMTFPQKWPVFENDFIIALNADTEKRHVFVATGGEYDLLPDYYILSVDKCYSKRTGVLHEFVYGTDFILYKGQRIKWISLNKPTADEVVSINYRYNLVYTVLGDYPAPRTSENNYFPRRVMLKKYIGSTGRIPV